MDLVFDSMLPCRNSSQKYLPLEWLEYFDQEDDISIPNSNDVSIFLSRTRHSECTHSDTHKHSQTLVYTSRHSYIGVNSHRLTLFCLICIILLGLSCIYGGERRTSCILSTWRRLLWVCDFSFFTSIFNLNWLGFKYMDIHVCKHHSLSINCYF